MPPEFLSVTPQRLRCYICGTFTESPNGWKYRLKLGGHSPVCPACVSTAEHQVEDMTANPNLPGAVMLGALAAIGGSVIWYGLTVATDHIYWVVAMGIGLLVGKAVGLGSGNKRGPALQVTAAILAFAGILGGRYLVLNHLISTLGPSNFSGWLTGGQFVAINKVLFKNGEGFADIIFSAVAIGYAVALLRSDKLVSEAPAGVHGWRRWVR
jgi:hypothetical protein